MNAAEKDVPKDVEVIHIILRHGKRFLFSRNMTLAFQKHDNMSVAEQCYVPTVYESWNSI